MKTLLIITTLVFHSLFGIAQIVKPGLFPGEKVFSDTTDDKVDQPLILAGPNIIIDKRTITFGKVPQYRPLQYNVIYKNGGNGSLIISKVRTSCSCTVASFSRLPLLPGESDTIKVDMDTDHVGEYHKIMAIYSNAINDYDSSIKSSRILIRLNWKVIKTKEEKKEE